jgi:hypothetical protein
VEHPNGVWIWNLADIRRDYLDALINVQCKRVYLKVLDDASSRIFWGWQCSPDIINAFKAKGIEVWGWGYIFDRRLSTTTSDIINALKRAIGCGIQGFVFDVEQEVESSSTHSQLREILVRAKEIIPNGCLGYTSFGAPKYHPHVPWTMLNEICDLQFPQIYYELFTFGSGDPSPTENKAEVKDCLQQHKDMGLDKPILPIWGSESGSTYPTTAVELQGYLDEYPGSSVWRVPDAGKGGEAWRCNYHGNKVIPDPILELDPVRDYKDVAIPLQLPLPLKLGSKGDDVYILICALMELGYLKKDKQVTSVFNINVDDAVRWAQRKLQVEVDGEVGLETKKTLEEAIRKGRIILPPPPLGSFNGAKFADFCESILSQNTPWSRNIDFIQPFVSALGRGSWHWCGATVYWLINEFLYKPNAKTMQLQYSGMEATFALVEASQQYFQKQGWYEDNRAGYVPPAGAIVIFDWDQVNINNPDQDYDNHIGVFLRMNGDLFVCGEGNTDRSDSYPNGRTAIRERSRQLIQGFGIIPEGWMPT